MGSNKIYLNKGNRNDVAFVFSAPGMDEAKTNRLASGKTGENLERLLQLIDLEPENDRYDFTITSVDTGVLLKEIGGFTETQAYQLTARENVIRLVSELVQITDYIIFFGEKAQSVAYLLSDLQAKFIFSKNLSARAVNLIDRDINGVPIEGKMEEDNEARLELISKFVIKQMKD